MLKEPSFSYTETLRLQSQEKVTGCCLVAKSCLTLCDPVDCNLADSSVHGYYQVRILEWVAISFSRGSSCPGIELAFPALQMDSLLLPL